MNWNEKTFIEKWNSEKLQSLANLGIYQFRKHKYVLIVERRKVK